MGNVIDSYMWDYQKHFHISLQVTADILFENIDPLLRPTVFLLGVLVEDRKDRHPICLEPADCGYSVNAFADIKKLAKELQKVDEETRILHSHPIAQEGHEKRISNRAFIEAIQKILKREDLNGRTKKFVSFPTYVDGFFVFVVLEIQKDIINKYYSLTKEKWNDRYKISRSLIESAIEVFLKESANALKVPNNTKAIERTADELLRESAIQFMYSISSAGNNIDGLHGLYDACNTIAALKYEGSEGLGKMVIAKKDHPNIRFTLQLNDPIRIKDFRKVRKFLELSNDNSLIISDSAWIYGLGEIMGKYNPKDESLFTINFISHYRWELFHDDNSMMIVEYKQPNIPKDKIDRDKFYSDLTRIFSGIEKVQLDDLWDITIQATKQKHGTMLVISDKAREEAVRLGKQSFTLKPLKLTTNLIQQITSIDGSVLLDRNSVCHSIGVILDGLATDNGDSSRGARFNSAIRYYEHFGKIHPTVLVIISEDGIINLIPNLKPQIKHSLITDEIENLKKLSVNREQNRKSFNQLMNFFENVEFYLTADECKSVNEFRKIIEDNFKGEGMRKVRKDLKPNDEMNESYYLN